MGSTPLDRRTDGTGLIGPVVRQAGPKHKIQKKTERTKRQRDRKTRPKDQKNKTPQDQNTTRPKHQKTKRPQVEHHGHLLEYAKSVKSNEAKSRKSPKTPVLGPFWTVFDQTFSVNFVILVVKHHGHLLEYAKSVKSNEAKSSFGPFWTDFGPKHFFSKIRLRHFSRLG